MGSACLQAFTLPRASAWRDGALSGVLWHATTFRSFYDNLHNLGHWKPILPIFHHQSSKSLKHFAELLFLRIICFPCGRTKHRHRCRSRSLKCLAQLHCWIVGHCCEPFLCLPIIGLSIGGALEYSEGAALHVFHGEFPSRPRWPFSVIAVSICANDMAWASRMTGITSPVGVSF